MGKDLPVLIYQMGKVGSSSIYMSLKEIMPTFHVHYLRKDLMDKINKNQINRGFAPPEHLVTSKMVLKKYIKKDKPLNIISLVRDPIARNMSAFFENLDNFILNSKNKYFKIPSIDSINQNDFNKELISIFTSAEGKIFNSSHALITYFDNNYSANINTDLKHLILLACFNQDAVDIDSLINDFLEKYNHDLPTRWFNIEVKKVLGYNIYDHKFSKKDGYLISNLENGSRLLVLKCELENSKKEKIIEKFLSIENFKILNHNIGTEKYYNSIYTAFKKKIYLPEEYIDKLLDSKFTKNFYSKSEITLFKSKWQIR